MEKYFLYGLGGISVSVATELQEILERTDAREEKFFSGSEASSVAYGDVHVCLSPFRQGAAREPIKKILSQELSEYYTTTRGYLQFFYLTAAKKDLAWRLAIDPEFSRFDYFVFLHNLGKVQEVINPCKLATRLFLLQHSFINHHGLILHAAGGRIQGKGIAFAAPSGTGKSTLTRLLMQFPAHRFFSEDRLIVRSVNDQWQVWGTPWYGEGDIARNESTSLAALIFLRQSKKTAFSQLPPAEGLRRLLQVVSVPWYSKEWTKKGLALCEVLVQQIPMFELAFRPDQTAVQAVERFAAEL